MRRHVVLVSIICGLLALAFFASAQDEAPDPPPADEPLIVTHPPTEMLPVPSGDPPTAVAASPTGAPIDIPLTINAASDTCAAAPELTFPSGDTTTIDTGSATESSDDPVLTCAWGNPSRDRGYRTVWYQFTAPYNGTISIDTSGSDYDTILAVYTGSCGALTQLSCNDDFSGFSSKVFLTVIKDQTYYVEVADWQSSLPEAATLIITALEEPFSSQWQQQESMPAARSRHAIAVAGNDIYVVGGQTQMINTPQITNRFERYDTDTGNWVLQPTLPPLPGTGLANTTAAYVDGEDDDGRIYVPGGFNGATYENKHWAYDIAGNYWITRTVPFAGTTFAWAQAVPVTSPTPAYYLTGGLENTEPFTSTAEVRNDVLIYFPDIDDWLTTPPPMDTPRYAHTAGLVNGRICVAGGISSGNVLLINGECYAPGSGVWTPTGNMNYPRYNAGSATGPDGKWYVFGGVDAVGNAVSETEVYDPTTNEWTVLTVGFDLGGSAGVPARAWPRGVTVDDTIYALGGNSMPQFSTLALMETLFVPSDTKYLPLVFNNFGNALRDDDTFATARQLHLNVAQRRNFDTQEDYFDVFYFDLAQRTNVTVKLSDIPNGSDYNFAIYDSNKFLWEKSDNLGNATEQITRSLGAGRYYIMVERVFPVGFPNTDTYRIIVSN